MKSCPPESALFVSGKDARSTRLQRSAWTLALGGGLFLAACASGSGNWFSLGPRPSEIAGVWIDIGLTSYSDTVAWVLAPNGDDRTMRITINGMSAATTQETWNGIWYLSGRLADTSNRAICYKRRVRNGATCLRFRMDTVATAPLLRRLTVLGNEGQRLREGRVFLERRRRAPVPSSR